ncbi:unnamed protein product [marine sediment metagenome]|uniref:Uncharacterized protein n=1 Tax=marine sediment metagenome TaxID=412755 RepID=X0SZ80_9ZZZZ
MLRNNNAIIIILLVAAFFFFSKEVCLAADYSWLEDAGWKVVESKHCTILLHPEVNMKKVNARIRIRFYSLDKSTFSSQEKTVEEQLAEKIDRIFKKVERVLDMYPDRMRLNLKVFKTQAQLDEEYAKIFGESDGTLRISYYIHKHSTIFTTEQAIREGVLAHEMGHAISDHYFLVKPAEKIKELLAQYAEIHLEE